MTYLVFLASTDDRVQGIGNIGSVFGSLEDAPEITVLALFFNDSSLCLEGANLDRLARR